MTNFTHGLSALLIAGITAFGATTAQAQCTNWLAPTPTTGWTDFNSMFGGAPCDDGSGCPFNEITDFEVYADEAYNMANVKLGGTYTFSACNGTGGTAWPLYFTIIAPSGNVDAFGLDAGSTCALTWTATEAGAYLIVVSEANACGTSTNASTANGFPAITCASGNSGNACPEPQPGCTTWSAPTATTGWTDFTTMFNGAPVAGPNGCPVNEITAFQVYADEAYNMVNVQQGVTYTFGACNGVGGTAWPLYFTIITPTGTVDAYGLDDGSNCALTWTASASGTYLIVVSEDGACGTSTNAATENGFPSITCLTSSSVNAVELSSFSVFPNPTSGMFTMNLAGVDLDNGVLEVMDLAGRVVRSERFVNASVTRNLDLSGQPAGTYFIRISGKGQMLRSKVVLLAH